MATYYVRKTGSDAAAGTAPGTAWLTIGKALGAAGIASGDTVYIGAGTYREAVTVAMTSATAETFVIGDIDGSQTGDAGDVVWTAYTTNDTTAPSASSTLNLGGRDFLTFRNFTFIGGSSASGVVAANTTQSLNIKLEKCVFLPTRSNIYSVLYTGLADVASNWVIDSCVFIPAGTAGAVLLSLPTSASADYDINFLIKNSLLIASHGAGCVVMTPSGAGAFKAGGVDIFNCTLLGGANAVNCNGANMSTSIPCTIYNSICWGQSTSLLATTLGQLVEDFNLLNSGSAVRTNVGVGTGSISGTGATPPTHSIMVEVGQAFLNGRQPRPFFTPMTGSPQLGFGAQAGGPTVDMLGVTRPAGGASMSYAIGALERSNTAVAEASVTQAGASAIKIVGPGVQRFDIPVDAASTTVTVYGQYDTTHADTNKPQMKVLNGGQAGVADATDTMTAAVDTWEQLSLNFTPTSKGIVTIELVSRAAAGGGIAYFDTFAVA